MRDKEIPCYICGRLVPRETMKKVGQSEPYWRYFCPHCFAALAGRRTKEREETAAGPNL